jgi:hypothetical protein
VEVELRRSMHMLAPGGAVEGAGVDVQEVDFVEALEEVREIQVIAVARAKDAQATAGRAEQGFEGSAVGGKKVPLARRRAVLAGLVGGEGVVRGQGVHFARWRRSGPEVIVRTGPAKGSRAAGAAPII